MIRPPASHLVQQCRWLFSVCCAALALLLTTVTPALALEPVAVEGGMRDGIGRMTLTFLAPMRVVSKAGNGRLVLRFDRPHTADFSRLDSLEAVAGPPEPSADGMEVSLPLKPGVTAFSVSIDRTLHVQFVPGGIGTGGQPRNGKAKDTPVAPATRTESRPSRRSGPESAPATEASERPPAGDNTLGGSQPPPPTDTAPAQAALPPPARSPAAAPPPPPVTAPPAPALASSAEIAAAAPTLRFGWQRPVAAAIFKRGAALWVVFDQPARLDLAGLRAAAGAAANGIEQTPHETATLLRFDLARPLYPQVQRDGSAWLVRLMDDPSVDGEPIVAQAEISGTVQARLVLPVSEPSPPVRFIDPTVGDELIAVPLVPLGRGVPVAHAYPHLNLLPSAQGIVIQPLTDDLRVRAAHDGVEITRPPGLALSPPQTDAAARARLRLVDQPSRLLPANGWDDAPIPSSAMQAARLQAIVNGEGPARAARQRDLAQVYLGHGMAAEALGMISEMERGSGAATVTPEVRLMRGIAHVLLARAGEASIDLSAPELAATDEGRLWLRLAEAAGRHPATAPDAWESWVTIADAYPSALRRAALLPLLDAAITAGRDATAARLIAVLRGEPDADEISGWLDYQEGRLKLAAGDLDAAAALWQRAVDGKSEPARARAIFERTQALLKAGRLSREAAIAELDGLRSTWRGDELEFRTLTTLAQLYADQDDIAPALRVWRESLSRFPGHPEGGQIADAMTGLFEHAFRDGAAERLPPWQAVALFHEFNELSPTGPRGDALLRAYAQRLAAAELPGRAAAVIETLLQSQRTDTQRAEVGLELAGYFNRDGQPAAALAALKRTHGPAVGETIAAARRLAEAEALQALGRDSESAARLGDDRSPEAQAARLRAGRDAADWPQVIQALQELSDIGDEETRQSLQVDRAAALSLAGDDEALVRLGQERAVQDSAGAEAELLRLLAAAPVPLRADTKALQAFVNDAKRLAVVSRSVSPTAPAP